jgi:hypothetical protein
MRSRITLDPYLARLDLRFTAMARWRGALNGFPELAYNQDIPLKGGIDVHRSDLGTAVEMPLIEFNMGCKRVSTIRRGEPIREAIGDDLRDWAMIGLIVFAASLLMWLSFLGSLHVTSLPLPH